MTCNMADPLSAARKARAATIMNEGLGGGAGG
jgi:hypothetical protein